MSTLLANTNGVSHGLLIPADVPSELVLSTRLRLPAAALPPDCSVYTRRFACRQASHPVSNTLLDLVPTRYPHHTLSRWDCLLHHV